MPKAPGQFGLLLDLTSRADYETFIDAYFLHSMGDPAHPETVYRGLSQNPPGLTVAQYIRTLQGSPPGYRLIDRYWDAYQKNQDPETNPVVSAGANLDVPGAVPIYGYDTAAGAVAQFLSTNYPLPAGWSYEVVYSELHDVLYNAPMIGGAYQMNEQYIITAKAVKPGRDTLPAGTSQVDPRVNGYNVSLTWKQVAENFPNVAKPILLNIRKACSNEDALSNPVQQIAGSPSAVTLVTSPATVNGVPVANANQGFSPQGQAPWDTQPDVVSSTDLVPKSVSGTIVGAGYVPTTAQVPDGFLDWLNLKVPDAATVQTILKEDPNKLQEMIDLFAIETAPTTVKLGLPQSPRVGLPNPYSFDQLNPNTVAGEPINDGIGFTEAQSNTGGGTAQAPPSNLIPFREIEDSVSMMMELNATDFLNMLAMLYRETLYKVATIPAARSELNDLIDTGRTEKIEPFLRDFNASTYATAPVVTTTTPVANQASVFDGKTALIVLGVLLGLYFVSRKAAA